MRVESTDAAGTTLARPVVVLEDLSWGNGVGWFVQRSIRLDAEHVDALLGALCCARQSARAEPGAGISDARTSEEGCPARRAASSRSDSSHPESVLPYEFLKRLLDRS